MMRNETRHYINGKWISGAGGGYIDVTNPSTGKVFGRIAKGTKEDVDKAVEAADAVYMEFRNMPVSDRRNLLDRIVTEYEKRKDDIIEVITDELGSPKSKSEKVHYEMGLTHFIAARDALDDFQFEERRGDALVVKESIGVAGLITPWNFPTNQTSLKLSAALAAGSPVILKPSEETPFSAIILAQIFEAAGVPKGVFNLVNGDGEGVGTPLSQHPKVRMVSFTGSGPTGSKIMEKASRDFKRVALELGGKSPYIILDDVDIDEAAKSAVQKVVNNTGQVCTAGTRTLIPESIKDEFLEKARAYMDAVVVGDPNDENTTMGPVISKK